jgi:hypothetical protein
VCDAVCPVPSGGTQPVKFICGIHEGNARTGKRTVKDKCVQEFKTLKELLDHIGKEHRLWTQLKACSNAARNAS